MLTDEIKKDFNLIFEYIADVLFNPQAAEKLVDKFYLAIQSACDTPSIYPIYKSYRKIVVDNYLVFFKVEKDTAIFMRAIYGGMNYGRFI